jgi:hypothetical protein
MPDRDTRNASTGETAQETADRLAGAGGPSKAEQAAGAKQPVDGGAKGPLVPNRPAPQNIHPSAKGVYGSPIDSQIVK